MILGLVSNCWRLQLSAGRRLDDLIAEAFRRGYRAIELRQTCLGGYETGENHVPQAAALAALPNRFPGVRFNLAVCVPFLSDGFRSDDSVFSATKWSAQAVAGEFPPHLRLVDLMTGAEDMTQRSLAATAGGVAALVRSLAEIDGVLSVENSRQPWGPFHAVVAAARRELGSDEDRLRLCFDPCNLLAADDGVNPSEIAASLLPQHLSMVHIKQRRDGAILPAVCEGDIDWTAQLAALDTIEYRGPFLFEVESHRRIWEFLAGSVEYLRRLGLPIEQNTVGKN